MSHSKFVIVLSCVLTYSSSEQLSGLSKRYPLLRRLRSSLLLIPGYGVPPAAKFGSIHEITIFHILFVHFSKFWKSEQEQTPRAIHFNRNKK